MIHVIDLILRLLGLTRPSIARVTPRDERRSARPQRLELMALEPKVLYNAVPALLISTDADVGSGGTPTLDSWTEGEVLEIADPNLSFDNPDDFLGTTDGTMTSLVDFDTIANDGDADVNGMHYVSRNITVGTGANTFDLLEGDLLVTFKDDETFTSTNSLSATDDEVIVYRPDTAGDYSSGSFFMLLDNLTSIHGQGETRGISLVEADTVVGDTTLTAGTFLLSTSGGAEDNDVRMLVPTGVGAGTTAGTFSVLLEGDDIGISPQIWGIDVVEETITIGGQTLNSGSILLTLGSDDSSLGDNNVSTIEQEDVFYLDVTQTTLVGGTTAATAHRWFDADDIDLVDGGENTDGFTLVLSTNDDPVVSLPTGSLAYTENATASVIDSGATVTDADGTDFDTGTLTVDFTANGAANDRLAINNVGTGAGQIGVSGSDVSYGGTVIGTFTGGTDGSTPLVITFDADADATAVQALARNITYENVSDDPSELTRTVRFVVTDGDGGTSAAATASVGVTAVNDDPVNTVPGTQTVAEETTTAISGLSIADDDAGTSTVTTRLQVASGVLNVTLAGAATISSGSNGSSDLTISGTVADINSTLASLTYTGNTDVVGTNADTITVTTNDGGNTGTGGALQDVDTIQVDITGVNDAPVNTVPGTQTVAEETTTAISGISISDVDAGSGNVTTRLQVGNGVLNVTLSGSATISAGSNGSGDLTISGTVTDVNATLASLTYTGDTDVVGTNADTITVTTDDGGNTGTGGALQDVDTIQVDITGVNDAPVNTVPGTQTVAEETTTSISGISISDVDAGSGNVTTRLQVGNGVLNVTLSGSATISSGSNGSGDLTISGTVADVNATLASLTYTGDTDVVGTNADTITVTTDDGGNTGTGGALQDVDTIQVDITGVNDAPVNTVPGTQTVAEETTTAISGISISDVDAGSGNVTTRLQVGNGVLNVTLSGSATISAGSNGSADLTISGTVTDVNATLASLTYTGNTDVVGTNADTITVTTNDGGNTGSGGALQDVDTIQIDITSVNDAPVLTPASPNFTTITEDDTSNTGDTVASLLGTSLTDVDSGAAEGIAVTGLVSGNGTWEFSTNGGSTWTAVGSVSDASALLLRDTDRLRFVPDTIDADTGSVTYRGWDQTSGTAGTKVDASTNGGTTAFSTATDTASITVTGVNDDPTNAGGLPTDVAVIEDVASNVDLSAIDLSDVDSGATALTVTLTTSTGGDLFATSGSGVTVGGNGTGALTLTGTLANLNAYLDTATNVTYQHGTTNTVGNDADTIQVEVTDNGGSGAGGGGTINLGTVNVDISEVNDAPVNTVPGTQTVAEETATSISGVSISDVDDNGGTVTTRLQVGNGVLNVTLSGSATISSGANGSGDLTISGTVADINSTLASLTYTGNTDVVGTNADTITVTTDDGGNTGTGGALQDVDTVQIDITGVNDAPVNTVPGTQTVAEETTTAISGISISDVDHNGGTVTTRLQIGNGVLNVTLSGGATISAGANGSADLTISGTVTDVNATLASLTYTGNTDVVGTNADTITVTTDDGGNTGTGGALQDVDTIQVDITGVNDAPVNTVPGTQTVAEETTTAISGISISDVDAGSGNVTTRLQVGNGVVNVTLSGSATISSGANGSGDLTISGTVADINSTLASLTYTGNTDVVGTNADTITLTTDDGGNTGTGGALQDVDTVQIDITGVNDAPVNTVPGTQTVAEETTTAISGISISDVDHNGGTVTTRLQIGNGVLNVTLSGGATISAGANGSADLTISGTVADVNATLASLNYTGDTGVTGTGADTITVTTDDGGNTGSGGALQDVDTIQVDISPVNDAPVVTAPSSSLNATEQTSLALHGTGFSVSDADEAGSGAVATLTVGEGTVTIVAGDSGVTVASGNGTGTVTVNGTIAEIDNLLTGGGTGTITYFNASDTPSASTTFAVTVNDQGNTGADPGTSGTATSEEGTNSVTIAIAAVNDAPVAVGETFEVDGGTTFAVNAASGLLANDSDVDGGTLTVSLVDGPANGVLILNPDGSFTYTPDDGFSGTDTFLYRVSDGAGGTKDVVATLEVEAVAVPFPTTPEPPMEAEEPTEDTTDEEESDETGDDALSVVGVAQESGGPDELDFVPRSGGNRASNVVATEDTTTDIEVDEVVTDSEDASEREAFFVLDFDPTAVDRTAPTVEVTASIDDPAVNTTVVDVVPGAAEMFEQLEQMEQELGEDVGTDVDLTAGTAAVVSALVGAGYAIWMIRGGYLMASLLSTMPAWRSLDPLPVLVGPGMDGPDDGDDGVEELFDGSHTDVAESSDDDPHEDVT